MQSEHNGRTDVDNDHCNGSSQTSIVVTSNMVPEEMMGDCPVDNCNEDSSLCRKVLSGSTEPCPGNLCYQLQLSRFLSTSKKGYLKFFMIKQVQK